MTLEPGLEAAFGSTVSEADTAALGSGEVPVLATRVVDSVAFLRRAGAEAEATR